MERPYESAAASVYMSIKRLAGNEDALSNFENYLAHHFAEWLEKFAHTPEDFAAELHQLSSIE